MSSAAPPPRRGNANTPSFQRIAIAVGTLVIVILTVAAALFLAFQDLPSGQTPTSTATEIAGLVVTPSNTPIPVASLATLTPRPPDTPTATPIPTATEEPTLPPPPTATGTATALPPTATSTSTSAPIVITPTPLPATPGACQPPASWVSYEVQRGDTLNSLAARTNTSVFELNQVNCLESFTLQVGQVIYLPVIPPSPTVTDTPSPTPRPGPTATRTPTAIAPVIESVSAQKTSTDIIVIVIGRNFRSNEAGFRAELVGPTTISLQVGQARTSTSFEASAPIPPDLPDPLQSGAYDLLVVNPSGQLDIERGVFPPGTPTPIPPAPSIGTVSSKISSTIVRLTITGNNFRPKSPGFRVELRLRGDDLTVELRVDETEREAISTSFDAIIERDVIVAGDYDLVITNPDDQTAIKEISL